MLGRHTINESGKKMFIHKILNENIDSLEYFKRIAHEQGFNDVIAEVITEFKKYNVNIDMLNSIEDKIENKELVQKIKEISIIYDAFQKKIHENYIDTEDEM